MNPQYARTLDKVPEPSAQPQTAPAAPPVVKKKSGASVIPWIIFLALAAVAAYFIYAYWQPIKTYVTNLTTAPVAASGRGRGGGPVPVEGAAARRGDVHIYLDGLGQVTPFSSVVVRTQVDGQIINIPFKEGQLVHAHDLLAEIDPRPYQAALEQAKGKLGSDAALLENAKLDLTRYQEANKNSKAVSDQQVATQQALVDQYVANTVTDQGQLDAAQVNLNYCRITSPIDGRIGLRLVDLGNVVHPTDANGLAVIAQLQPIAVVFTLPEDDLGQVVTKPNMGDGLTVLAYDRDDQQLLTTGAVEAVDNAVDPTTGTFKVKASFANKDNSLFPSQFVNAHLLADILHDQLIVPVAAVQHGPDGGAFVYVVKSDQSVEIRTVQEGAGEGDSEAVTGIDADEIVVTDGTDKLQAGSKVNVTMTSESGLAATRPTTRASGRGRGGRGRGRGSATTNPS